MAATVATFIVTITLLLAAPLTHQHEVLPFGYSGSIGPDKWGSLNPYFSACDTGKLQSPVNIVKENMVENLKLPPLTNDYRKSNSTLINYGFNIGMQYESNAGVLIQDGKNYTLKQMDWHSPSEHTINSVRYPLELQLVHVADDGKISVVAILYNYGYPDPLLFQLTRGIKKLANEICREDEEVHIPVAAMRTKYLRHNSFKYYRYVGSLTTPPCTENVTWSILGKVRNVAKEQIDALRAPLDGSCKSNARHVQPLNGRTIEFYDVSAQSKF
ncbi:alpha carbonic anhydrase 1, chloroplastic-like [Macadamia integrifolia]|uniref:alpha carbonic anhydrase 1, chloroplastic-like n=1 Tax=Macadamia integrifolia TaxID=60698 RepID=UPI001C4FD82D|nr:alpha carbonic anhydrase 1, chloroplastic-like [Macadamia integrifolia]